MHALSVCVMIRPIAGRQIDQNDGGGHPKRRAGCEELTPSPFVMTASRESDVV